jgi:tetratricopeptide (TPR) repeat protein
MKIEDKFNQGLYYVFKTKDLDKAIIAFSDVIKMDPKRSSAFNNRGNCYFKKGLYEKAIQDFDDSLLLRPQELETYKFREWIIYFKNWADCNNNHLEVNSLVHNAIESAWNQDYNTAFEYFTKIFQMCSNNAFIFYQRGLLYAEIGEKTKAINDFNETIKIIPTIAAVYYDRGNLYRKQEMYDKSLDDYNIAIQLYPKFSDAFYNRGIIHFLKEEYELAFEDYKITLEINPNDNDARINLIKTIKYLK